jgi:hypothetical protein
MPAKALPSRADRAFGRAGAKLTLYRDGYKWALVSVDGPALISGRRRGVQPQACVTSTPYSAGTSASPSRAAPVRSGALPAAHFGFFCKFSFVSTLDQSALRRGATVTPQRSLTEINPGSS